ncbi:MAG TPA: hypothetical protein PKA42_02985 [Candidatus Paceibacterota bacterium]|nr:hypothetical protein [Candidatus Paceibacterota bacterium]HMO83110.1 hypothetical protein [Candidatus Paceibacterota bacterium]
MDEQELFDIVASQIEESVALIADRIQKLDELGRGYVKPEDIGKASITLFLVRSLGLWVRVLRFTANKIRLTDNDEHYFALSNMRTLTDVFGRIIGLLEKDDDDVRAIMCILYILYTASKLDDVAYQEWLKMYVDYPALQEVKVPATAKECDWRWYKNSGYLFAGNNSVLTEEILKKYTVETSKVFSNKSTYEIFTHLSEALHGNPMYHRQAHNERFWLASMSISLTANLIEVIDQKFLDRVRPRDFRVWLQGVDRFKKELLQAWTGNN